MLVTVILKRFRVSPLLFDYFLFDKPYCLSCVPQFMNVSAGLSDAHATSAPSLMNVSVL